MKTSESQTSSTDYPGLPKTLSLLVVEDENRLRDLLQDVARDMGFEPTGARSAEEALRLLTADPRPLLIVDLNLPGISGIEFLEQVRMRWPDTQAIIITGFGTLETARRAIHLDVVEFLTKPSPLSEVERALDRARRRIDESRTRPLPAPKPSAPPQLPDRETLADQERQIILTALERNHGNRTQTALALGISRRTLHSRLRQYQQSGWYTP